MKSTALVRALTALVIATMMGALMSFVAAPDAAANGGSDSIYKPICIEASMLQGDPAFASLRLNGEIQADAYTTYFVQAGVGCTFDCADGFDANCDGKFGDYCRVEIDRKVVSGAGTCIAELGPAVQPLPPAMIHDVPTTLAHTGAETPVIAFFGLGLTAFGATAMGVRRRLG